jgi:hypothetical protein
MAEVGDRCAGGAVEISLASLIVQIHTFAALDERPLTATAMHNMLIQ